MKNTKTELDFYVERAVLEINGGCNYTCQMCPQTNPDGTSGARGKKWLKKMTLNDFERHILELKNWGLMVVQLEGSGEATLNNNLPEYIRICTENNVQSFIFSNGYKMQGSFMRDCVDAGLSLFRFSVIGFDSLSYMTWMRKNAFERVRDNATEMVEYSSNKRTRIASYHLILDTNNIEEEVTAYRKNFVEPAGTLGEIWKMHNWSGVYRPNYQREGGQKTCGRPFAPELTIRANGMVHPCCQVLGRDDEAVLGDLNHQTVKEVWNGSEYQKLRKLHIERKFEDTPYCADCDFLTDDTEVLVWKNSETAMLKMRGTKFNLNDYRS